MKNILITRSFERSKNLVKHLQKRKFIIHNEKLFDVLDVEFDYFYKNDVSALVLTSFSSCKAVLSCNFPRNIKIFAIGKQTAEILVKEGFNNIELARDRSAISLCEMIKSSEVDKNLKILYFRGLEVSFDILDNLSAANFFVEEIICYKINKMNQFSEEFIKKVKNYEFDAILIYSQNSARIFYELAKKHYLIEYLKKPKIYCFSKHILSLVKDLGDGVWCENSAIYNDFLTLKNYYDR